MTLPTRDEPPRIVRSPSAPPAHATMPTRPPEAQRGVTARDMWRVIRKRKWMIMLSVLTLTVIAAAGTGLWLFFAPWYTATAYLGVNPERQSVLIAPGAGMYQQNIMDRRVQEFAELVDQDPVLNRAVQAPGLQQTKWYRDRDKKDVVQDLYDDIRVSVIPNTNLIRVSMTGTVQKDLPEIVNAVADAFKENMRDQTERNRREEIHRLEEEQREQQNELRRTENQITNLRGDAPTGGFEQGRNAVTIEIQAIVQKLTELQVYEAQVNDIVQMLRQQWQDKSIVTNPQVIAMLNADRQLLALENMKVGIETQLESFKRRVEGPGPLHRQSLVYEAQLDAVKMQIDEVTRDVTEEAAKSLITVTEGELAGVRAQILSLRTRLNAANARLTDMEARMTQLQTNLDKSERIGERMQTIDNRLADLRALGESLSVEVRQPATLPREPSQPLWIFNMPLGVLLGLVVGFGLAFLLEFMDTSIKAPSDISRRVDLPLLGTVPHTDDLAEDIEDVRRAFMTNPNSPVCEAFRQIRTCLMFSGPASQRRSLLVTSPMPQDGRGTVSLNLAAAFARNGRKVLVVDANFRRPTVHELFPEARPEGFSSALVSQANWPELTYEVEPNLSVMASGPLPPNPAELLGSEQMRKIVAEMTDEYDQVIFDGPPCLLVSDGPVTSTMVDGVVMVVRAGANTYGIVQRSRDMLSRVGAHIVGVVLNGVRVTSGGYLRKNYETFYEYHEQAQLPAK